MAIEAFVMPVPGKTVGVVFWESRQPTGRGGREPRGSAGELTVYSQEDLSPGEAAEIRQAYASSLGEALRQGERAGGVRPALAAWWVLGTIAAALLTIRALDFGPGYSWLILLAALATLPWGAPSVFRPAARRRYRAAAGLVRRLGDVTTVPGTERRWNERLSALWQFARRQRGPEPEQLAALESYCRENGWPAAAQFYGDRRTAAEQAATEPARRRWLARRPRRRGEGAYTLVELRMWR